MQSVTLIDNYDSFTFNLVHYFGALGAKVKVLRNDQATVGTSSSTIPTASCFPPVPARRAKRESAST